MKMCIKINDEIFFTVSFSISASKYIFPVNAEILVLLVQRACLMYILQKYCSIKFSPWELEFLIII